MTGEELNAVLDAAPSFYGIYGEGAWAARFCREHGLRLFGGTGFNLFNHLSAVGAESYGAERIVYSKELSSGELSEAGCAGGFALVGGGVKVMDLVHCPFGRSCGNCDKRRKYILCDEAGRQFPLLRYETSVCRFELYNSVLLSAGDAPCRAGLLPLYDLTALSDEEKEAILSGKGDGLPHTAGAFRRGVN